MKRIASVTALACVLVALVLAQQSGVRYDGVGFDVKSVFPREVSPARYEQVEQQELQSLAEQGWELVSVTPYVYRNEERGGEAFHPRPVVTQTYPAYFFKRARAARK